MAAHTATFGVYRDKTEVKQAVKALKVIGFRPQDISVMSPDRPASSDFAYQPGNQVTVGILFGSILGVITAFVLAIVGAMMPSIRPMYSSLYAPIFGVILGGALGAACGALVGIGTPALASRRYSNYLTEGGILLSVHTDTPESSRRACQILEKTGAQDINALNEESV